MAKRNDGALILLIVIIAIPISIYNHIGPFWFSTLLLLLISSAFMYFKRTNKNAEFNGQRLILDTIEGNIPKTQYKHITTSLSRSNFKLSQLIRLLQIARDSIDICLTSSIRDTAESRYKLLVSTWSDIRSEYPDMMSEPTKATCDTIYENAVSEYHTACYINQLVALIEKARTLKTDKSKQKYKLLAQQVLDDGYNDPLSDKARLAQFHELSSAV